MKRFLIFVLFLVACAPQKVTFFTGTDHVDVFVDVADTPEARAHGFMDTGSIPSDSGMLFVFPDNQPRTFWMKNVTVPLDMIFVDNAFTVIEVKSRLPPCTIPLCPVFPSIGPAQYVVETNAGFADAHQITAGSKMTMQI